MKRSHLIISLLIIPLLAFGLHKHYISLTKVEYVKEQKSVQITMRFFIDDIELALENQFDETMELATQFQNKKADKLLETYVRQNFKIWINDSEMIYNYLGKEYEDNEVFFYLEIENVNEINEIAVKNRMLLNEFEDQQNYIKLNIETVQKTFILVRANDKEMLKL